MKNKQHTKWPQRKTPEKAMLVVQPNYLRYGSSTPQFRDVCNARRHWVINDRWQEFSLSEIGEMFKFYELEISLIEEKIKELIQQKSTNAKNHLSIAKKKRIMTPAKEKIK